MIVDHLRNSLTIGRTYHHLVRRGFAIKVGLGSKDEGVYYREPFGRPLSGVHFVDPFNGRCGPTYLRGILCSRDDPSRLFVKEDAHFSASTFFRFRVRPNRPYFATGKEFQLIRSRVSILARPWGRRVGTTAIHGFLLRVPT